MEDDKFIKLKYDGSDLAKGQRKDKGQIKQSDPKGKATAEASVSFGDIDLELLTEKKKKKIKQGASKVSKVVIDSSESQGKEKEEERKEKEKEKEKRQEKEKGERKRPAPEESRAPTSRPPKDRKVQAIKRGGPSTIALQEVPYWKKLIEDASAGSSGDPPTELLPFAEGVFEKATPAFMKREYQRQPFDMFVSKVVKQCFELGIMANMVKTQALELEGTRYNDPPESLVKRWEEEKANLTALMEQKAQDLKSEKEAFEKEKKDVEQVKADLASAKDELARKEKEWAEKEKEWASEKKILIDEADQKFHRFLQSPALTTLASNLAAPAMKNGLYALASALGNHYPFKPEELNLSIVPNATPNLEGYTWDEERGVMVTPEGEVMQKPTGVFPDLKNLQVKYPWKTEEWPDEYAEVEEEDDGDDEAETTEAQIDKEN